MFTVTRKGKRGKVHSLLTGNTPSKTVRQAKRSQNGRTHVRSNRQIVDTEVNNAVIPEWSPNDEVEGWEVEDSNDMVDLDNSPFTVTRRYISSDDPMRDWEDKKQEFLNEFMRLEAQSEEARAGFCRSCRQKEVDAMETSEEGIEGPRISVEPTDNSLPLYRCRDCFGGDNECLSCCLEHHAKQPLHRIQKWNGSCFENTTLVRLGLQMQLGHGGGRCAVPEEGRKAFSVLHVNGVHSVTVDYCGCERRIPRRLQLLRAGWYPATVKYPATVATIDLLKHFHGLSLCSKVSAHEYYLNLERLTDNSRVHVPKTRYRAFLRMMRQYRHLLMLKRGGRGNTKDGVTNIAAGELALKCPACPEDGVNLPSNWMAAAVAMGFLYTLFVSIDANFRLKNRMRDNKDRGLHTGLAYFVEEKPYNEHVLKYATQADLNSCSSFSAIARADSKSTTGLRYTGVGMCVCSRHELIRPLGVGDLQKGERYCNMDYIFLSAVSGVVLSTIMAIYDIACQWKVNLWQRMTGMPSKLQLPPSVELDFAIPKCHCPAHKLSCQTPHSLNLKPGAARTDGEGIERDWSMLNPAANSTKEMGPGSRHDTLDDLFAYHNWQKTTGLGTSLRRKYFIAAMESKRHTNLHRDFNESVSPETQTEWTKMITAWEKDKTMPNPYVSEVEHQTESDVKVVLLESERGDVGLLDSAPEKTATSFILMGLVIEETQRRIKLDVSEKDITSVQTSLLQERRLNLARQIKRFRIIQRTHIPLDPPSDDNLTAHPEDVPLGLPSEIPAHNRHLLPPTLFVKESRLREAQCYDALERIRLTQRAKRHVVFTKAKKAASQRAGTRTCMEFTRLETKIKQSALKYCAARKALVSLVEEAGVPGDLRELHDADIVPPPAFDFDIRAAPTTLWEAGATQLGEGYRVLPWIWRVAAASGDEDDEALNVGLRTEWAKSRARSLRWSEEVVLLKEEMRRVRLTFQFRSKQWRQRAVLWEGAPSDPTLAQGISAYAIRQALVYERLLAHFTQLWEKPPHKRANLPGGVPPGNEQELSLSDEAMITDLLFEAREEDIGAEDDADGDDTDDVMDVDISDNEDEG